MHLYFFLRGINQQVELTKIFLQSQFFKWKRINLKTNKEDIKIVQGALRPTLWGAWEYVFPEEALPDVLSMLEINRENQKTKIGRKFKFSVIRKMFGAKKIPNKDLIKAENIAPDVILDGYERALTACRVGGVACHIIGTKKDKREKWEKSGYEQEML